MTSRRATWRKPPLFTADLTVSSTRTVTIGLCSSCSGLMRLVVNSDCAELSIAHELPACEAWRAEGVLTIGKTDDIMADALDSPTSRPGPALLKARFK